MDGIEDIDHEADKDIEGYVDLQKPKSFFLLAGAGSGKTRSLVRALNYIKTTHGQELMCEGRQIAVITYTKAASGEIKERLKYNSLFHISTIHSFAWLLIKDFPNDIRNYLEIYYRDKIFEKKTAIENNNNSSSQKYRKDVSAKEKYEGKLERLPYIKKFTYNPDSKIGDREDLSHSQVIEITAKLISDSMLMPKLLIQQFPIIFIDECQDTDKILMNSLLKVEKESELCMGLFGDMMQRIYNGGKVDLIDTVKEAVWKQPKKRMNWRSAKRIVEFINRVRKDDDGLEQIVDERKINGLVRIYIIPNDPQPDHQKTEEVIKDKMILELEKEKMNSLKFNRLILEHHMAANRYGFDSFFTPLYQINDYKEGIRDGTLQELKFLKEIVYGLFNAYLSNDKLEIANLVKKKSLILQKENLKDEGTKQVGVLKDVNRKMNQFLSIFDHYDKQKSAKLTINEVVASLRKTNLFEIPEMLSLSKKETDEEKDQAWIEALNADFDELVRYIDYTNDLTGYITQQGSKGLEYSNVLVILDDKSAKGNQFSFEKLFGVKSKSPLDINNEKEGKDNSVSRTRRLFYVACSRAEESLGIIIYTEKPKLVRDMLIERNYVTKAEVEIIGDERRCV